MLLEEMRNNLASKVENRDFMTPSELEKFVIPISVRQQTKMRYEKRFPIAHHKAGKSVYYLIESIVDYMVDGKQEPTGKITTTDLNLTAKTKLSSRNKKSPSPNGFDLSHAFSFGMFIDDLREELQVKQSLLETAEKHINRKSLHDTLQDELAIKEKKSQKQPM